MRTVLAAALLLAGCTKEPPVVPFEPEAPRAALMVPPKRLPAAKTGDNLGDAYSAALADHGRLVDKVRGLQGYINTLLKKRLERQKAAKI